MKTDTLGETCPHCGIEWRQHSWSTFDECKPNKPQHSPLQFIDREAISVSAIRSKPREAMWILCQYRNHADKLAVQLGRLERIARDTIGADGALIMACDNAKQTLANYEAAQ